MAAKRTRRIEWLLFAAAWLVFAFFHQGGGWNQNARFAMVRAVVETGRLDVDGTLVYEALPGDAADVGRTQLRRLPVEDGAVRAAGGSWLLTWPGDPPQGVRPARRGETPVPLGRVAASGDLAFFDGRLHPNKAPGTALLAVPGYLLIRGVERVLGLDPDDWWVLTVNAWLCSVLSVGLLSAVACVLLRRVAVRLWPGAELAATVAAASFAFATIFFPYATMLFEQNIAAAGLLASFLSLDIARSRPEGTDRRAALLSGLAAGYAAITSYVALLPVILLAAAAAATRRRGLVVGFAAGVAVPLIGVGVYHQLCYGTPFSSGYAHQNPLFLTGGALLQVLDWPRLERVFGVIASPFRGLFVSSPVLLVGAAGLLMMAREPRLRGNAGLFAAIVGSLLLFNVCFNGWHGGWGVGPRYLIPALPFLALPITAGFRRWPRLTALLAVLSAAGMTVTTAVDAQPSVGLSSLTERSDRADPLLRDPLGEYTLPIFFTGSAGPILRSQRQAGVDPSGLEAFRGPVSANPIGIYEGWLGRLFPVDSPQAAWNSFNLGELLWPQSRLSLLPLLVPLSLLAGALLAAARAEAGADLGT